MTSTSGISLTSFGGEDAPEWSDNEFFTQRRLKSRLQEVCDYCGNNVAAHRQ